MSDGVSATVDVLESTDPAKVGIDASQMPDGSFRQRVDAPTIVDKLASIEDVLETCALMLASLKNQLPRVSSARVASVAFDAAQAVTVSSGTVTTVTTCATVTTLANMGAGSRPADAIPMQTSHMGAFHLYNAITVS